MNIMKFSLSLTFRRAICFVLLAAPFWHSPTAGAAVGLALIPSSISNTYSGQITLQITGLTNGETVLIEQYLDANTNSLVDAGESLAESFKVTDGQVTSFGGVRDVHVPGDEDGAADGQIQTKIFFSTFAEFARGAGTHLFRLSSPGSRFTPVTQSLDVTQAAFGQRITGQITSGGSPVTNATVALLVQAGQDVQFVVGAAADASGNFSITAAPGTYLVLPAKTGLVSDLGIAPVVTLSSSQVITQNLSLTQPTRTASGRITDAASGNGIPGIQLFIESTTANTVAFAFSDANGDFTVSVLPDQWKINISDFSLTQIGYLRPQNKVRIDTTGNVTGVSVPLARETALIYGSLKNSANNALSNVTFFAADSYNQYEGSGVTDSSGNYSLGVIAGSWNVEPDSQNPALAGYLVQGTNVTVTNGQAMRVDFVARQATAHLIGHVTVTIGGPISDIGIIADDFMGGSTQSQTGSDGSFDMPVSGGTWHLQLESQTATQRGLVGPDLQFAVTDGVNVTGINYVVRNVTAHITGSVKDSGANAVPGVNIYAFVSVNGTNYNANSQTDTSGNYDLSVFNGGWQVGVDCFSLSQLGYSCTAEQSAVVNGANQTVNFTVQHFTNAQPLLSQLAWLPSQFQLHLAGESGRNYRIDATTNLLDWTTLSTNMAFGGSFVFIDSAAPGFNKRFYRAVLVP
jgi:hypothetical protein